MSVVSVLYSGSSGNCTFVGDSSSGVLIDIGGSYKKTIEGLAVSGISIAAVRGVYITHEHIDHVKGLKIFQKKHPEIPVYANGKTISELIRQNNITDNGNIYIIEDKGNFSGEYQVIPFETLHDSVAANGYIVKKDGVKIAGIATDLGCVTDIVRQNLYGCPTVVIESNYDKAMLAVGKYAYYLKQRIMSDEGHLSNDQCCELLPALVNQGTTRIILAHLSKENNMPDIALGCAENALAQCGISSDRYVLVAASRDVPTKPIFF